MSESYSGCDGCKHGVQAAETSEKDTGAGQTGAPHTTLPSAELPTSYSGMY